MENKKEIKEEPKKKTTTKKTETKKSTTSSNTKKKTTTSTTKKNTTTNKKASATNTVKKKSTTSNVKKKTTTKKVTTVPKKAEKKVEDKVKDVTLVDVFARENNIDFPKEVSVKENISEQEKIEKDVIEEVNNVNVARLEECKYIKKKNKKLLIIGVFVVVLGVISLIISLIANRIIDRYYLSDSTITLMMAISLIIEGFGAFIIINES